MAQCAVQSCNNKSGKDLPEGVTFHLFPKDPQVRQVWIDATGNGSDWKPDRHQICSEHFQEKCFQQLKKSRRLFVWAIPTLKLRNLNSPTASERAAPAPSEPEPEEPAEPDGETPELNEEIQKRKRLDEIFVKPQCATCRKRAALNVSSTKLEGQAKSIVSKVYHFLSEEFKDIKDRYGDAVDLTPLSRFRQRTAYACGVSYRAVGLVLKEEQDWMEARASPVEEPPVKKRKAARVQTDGDIESPIDSSSEDNNNEEENFQTEQSTTEAEESEPVEKETSSEGTQEETVQGTLDVNQNYDDNAETMESVSVEFEFHDMEAASNQSSQEPSIITMINQSDNENQSIPEQNIESIENLDNQSLIEPTIIAVVDSNQSNVNQVINSLNPGMKPTLIRMVDSMGNQSGLVDQALMVESGVMDQAIIEPGVNDLVMDQAMVEPAIITMIDPNLPEIEQPMFEPRFDLEPTIITVVAGDGPVIENPCGNMCCEERATLTMISESSDPPPELQQDVQDDSQLNSNGESSNDFEVAQYTQQNDSEGDQYIEQDESVEHEYNEQNESTDFNEQNDSISQDNGENETICNEFSVQNEDGCDGSEFIQDNSCEDNVFNEQNDCNCEQEDCNTDQQSPSSSIEGEGQVEQLEGGMPPPDFVDSACQTDRDTDTPLQVAAAAAPIEYCEVNPMNTIELVPAMAHLEAQAIVAEPQYFAGAEGENLNVQRVECGDGYGYFVILN